MATVLAACLTFGECIKKKYIYIYETWFQQNVQVCFGQQDQPTAWNTTTFYTPFFFEGGEYHESLSLVLQSLLQIGFGVPKHLLTRYLEHVLEICNMRIWGPCPIFRKFWGLVMDPSRLFWGASWGVILSICSVHVFSCLRIIGIPSWWVWGNMDLRYKLKVLYLLEKHTWIVIHEDCFNKSHTTNTSFHVDIATQILANETLVSELVFLVFLVLDLVH